MQRSLALVRLERAIKDWQVLRFETRVLTRRLVAFGRRRGAAVTPRRRGVAATFNIFDRVERVDMRDDALDLVGAVTQFFQGRLDGLIDDLEHAAAGQQL